MEEYKFYYDVICFVKFLVQWKFKKDDFFIRVLEFSKEMVECGFYEMYDVVLIQVWLEDLISVGYEVFLLNFVCSLCRKVISDEIDLYLKEYFFLYLCIGKELKELIL